MSSPVTPPPADTEPDEGKTKFFDMMDEWADARAARIAAAAEEAKKEEPERTKQDGPKSFLSQFLNFE